MSPTYYPLLIRDDMHSPWGVHFGDWERATVNDERDDLRGGGLKPSQIKMIQTTGKQSEIAELVSHLNSTTA